MQTTSKPSSVTQRKATERPMRRPRKKSHQRDAFRHAMRSVLPRPKLARRPTSLPEASPHPQASRGRQTHSVEDVARDAMANGTMQPFSPTPSVLFHPVTAVAVEANVAGSGVERAQAAAMAERLLESVRVGRVGAGHEVHMRLTGVSGRSGIDVQLRHENGELTAVLRPEADSMADADRLAHHFARELRARGLDIEDVRVEPR